MTIISNNFLKRLNNSVYSSQSYNTYLDASHLSDNLFKKSDEDVVKIFDNSCNYEVKQIIGNHHNSWRFWLKELFKINIPKVNKDKATIIRKRLIMLCEVLEDSAMATNTRLLLDQSTKVSKLVKKLHEQPFDKHTATDYFHERVKLNNFAVMDYNEYLIKQSFLDYYKLIEESFSKQNRLFIKDATDFVHHLDQVIEWIQCIIVPKLKYDADDLIQLIIEHLADNYDKRLFHKSLTFIFSKYLKEKCLEDGINKMVTDYESFVSEKYQKDDHGSIFTAFRIAVYHYFKNNGTFLSY